MRYLRLYGAKEQDRGNHHSRKGCHRGGGSAKKRRNRPGETVRLTPEWFLWYGLKIGLTYDQTMDLPLGELLDLVAIEQIKHEGARLKHSAGDGEEEFFALLNRR